MCRDTCDSLFEAFALAAVVCFALPCRRCGVLLHTSVACVSAPGKVDKQLMSMFMRLGVSKNGGCVNIIIDEMPVKAPSAGCKRYGQDGWGVPH